MPEPLKTRFTSADESPGFLLWQVSNQWQRAQRAALEPLDLTHVQFVLLAGIAWLGLDAIITQAQLAQHTRNDVMMVSDVARTLERKGLIVREPHPRDSRAKALHLTPAGRALAQQAVAVVEGIDAEFFGRLGEHAADFTDLLLRLRTAAD